MKTQNRKRGLIKLIVIIIVAVLLLNYFHVDLVAWAEKLHLKAIFTQLWPQIQAGWQKVLELWHYLTNK